MNRRGVWCILFAVLLLLTACGGTSDDRAEADARIEHPEQTAAPAEAAAPADTPAPTETPEPTPVPSVRVADAAGSDLGTTLTIPVGRENQVFIAFLTENTTAQVAWNDLVLEKDGLFLERCEKPAPGAYLSAGTAGTFTVRLLLDEPGSTFEQVVTVNAVEEPGEDALQPAYPYLDVEGYWHYLIVFDGELLTLDHDALIPNQDNKNNEILYPFSEILDKYGVAYYWNTETDDFSSVVNGVELSRDCNDGTYMWFTNQDMGYGNCLAPRAIDGVFYTPNYAFEHTMGAVLTKISKGSEESRRSVEINTSSVYIWGEGSTDVPVMRWVEAEKQYVPEER